MQILRTGYDAWGRPVLEGISWDLIRVAFVVGAVVIVGHALYRLLRGQRGAGNPPAPRG